MAIQKYRNGWRVNVHSGTAAQMLPAPHTGKKRLTKVVRTSLADAEQVEREFQELVEQTRSGGTVLTVKGFLNEFLDLYTGTTRMTYDFAMRRFVASYGDSALTSWDEAVARKAAADLPKGNVIVVKTFFTKAVANGKINSNPFRDVAPSSGRATKTKEEFHAVWPLDPAEQRKLFEHIVQVADNEFGPDAAGMIAWQGWTGVRPGETFVLRHDALNLAADSATLTANFDRSIGAESPGTKNHLSRIIVVPPVASLRTRLAAMTVYVNQPYVFTNAGKPWTPPTWNKRWTAIRRLAGAPKMRFYDLRHFCATQLVELGVDDRDVAVQLGHTDGGELVRTVYSHPSHDAARERIRNTLTNFAADSGNNVRHINTGKVA